MKTSILSRIKRVSENLYRDPESGRYYGLKKIAGKQKLHSLDTTDKAIAKGRLADWLRDLNSADATAAAYIKFEAFLQRFLDTRKGLKKKTIQTELGIANTIRGKTAKKSKKRACGFERGMAIPFRAIRTSDFLKWLTDANRIRGWSFEYYNRCRQFIQQLCELASADRIITKATNPFDPEIIKKRRREGKKVHRPIPTLEQFKAIIASVRAQRDNPRHDESADFLELEGLQGVGQAEAWSLMRENIQPICEKGRVVDGDVRFIRQKTQREFSQPIFAWSRDLFEKLLAQPARTDGRIFTIRDAKKSLTAACKRLGFRHFTQRNLRAFCINRLYREVGLSPKQIAKLQGHNDGGILIQRIYTEVFSDNDGDEDRAIRARVSAAHALKIAA